MKLFAVISPVGWITLVCIFLMEAVFLARSESLAGFPFLQPTSDDATVMAKRALIRRTDGAIVLIGDSSCMFGLIPGIIQEATRVPCINLGTLLSFTMAGYESLLEETEETHVPAAVVVVLNPRAFQPDLAGARRFGMLGRYLLAYGRGNRGYAPGFKDFQSLLFRKHQLNSFPEEFGGSFDAFAGELDSTAGYFPEFHRYLAPKNRETGFVSSDFTRNALARLVAHSRSKGIPVYFWWSPLPQDAVDPGYLSAANALGREIGTWDGIKLLQDTLPTWHPGLFATVTHLNARGAEANSRILAGKLLPFVRH
ncbi:MAG: hypothetical protein JWP91_1631 [Fibrobacteres bacterium]|nr:hypothetical protein [Fibrobacterota bacterium]